VIIGVIEDKGYTQCMASHFSFYSFSEYEFLISTITFFDINNSNLDIKKCNCWYQDSRYQDIKNSYPENE